MKAVSSVPRISAQRHSSSAITEAERGPPSMVISPKYSPGPSWFSTTSRPFSSET
jgi:hypothetical protein